jgi:hypothetical protein
MIASYTFGVGQPGAFAVPLALPPATSPGPRRSTKAPLGICVGSDTSELARAAPLESSNALGSRRSATADNVGRSLLALGPLAIAASGRDLSIAAHVDDSIEICAMPYHAIFGKFLGLMLGPWMRRAAGQQAFFIVVDSKSHVASTYLRPRMCGAFDSGDCGVGARRCVWT